MTDGLFLNWLNIEKRSKSQIDAIAEINKACGTSYSKTWPATMKNREYSLERLPTSVRLYMMNVVLRDIFPREPESRYKYLIKVLT